MRGLIKMKKQNVISRNLAILVAVMLTIGALPNTVAFGQCETSYASIVPLNILTSANGQN